LAGDPAALHADELQLLFVGHRQPVVFAFTDPKNCSASLGDFRASRHANNRPIRQIPARDLREVEMGQPESRRDLPFAQFATGLPENCFDDFLCTIGRRCTSGGRTRPPLGRLPRHVSRPPFRHS